MKKNENTLRGLVELAGLAFITVLAGCSSEPHGSPGTCPAAGAAQETNPRVLASEETEPRWSPELSTDATHVYWTTYDPDSNKGQISSVTKSGDDHQVLASFESRGEGLRAEKGDELYLSHRGAFWGVPKKGGAPRVITEALPDPVWGAFEIDDEYAYHLGDRGGCFYEGNSIVRVALANGEVKVLATDLAQGEYCGAADLALDEESIFFSLPGDPDNPGQIFRLPKSGGTPKLLGTADVNLQAMAVRGAYVYFQYTPDYDYYDYTTYFGVARVPKSGGPVELLTEPCYYGSNFLLSSDSLVVYDLSAFIELSLDGAPLGQRAKPFKAKHLGGQGAPPDFAVDEDGIFLFVGRDLVELGREGD